MGAAPFDGILVPKWLVPHVIHSASGEEMK